MKIKTLIIIISLFIMSCNNKNVPSVPKHYIEYCNKIGGIHYNVHKKRILVDDRNAHLPSNTYIKIDCIVNNNYIIYVNSTNLGYVIHHITSEKFKRFSKINNVFSLIKLVLFVENKHLLNSIEIVEFGN